VSPLVRATFAQVAEIVNKVAQSGLITLNLEEFLPKDIVPFDIEPYLFQGLILKEKDFRAALKEIDWTAFGNKHVALFCSTDAIIPHWAYMLLSTYLVEHAISINTGTLKEIQKLLFLEQLRKTPLEQYTDKRMIIKGCGDEQVDAFAYVEITWRLLPIAKSIMYGEPCSTVPVYKKKS